MRTDEATMVFDMRINTIVSAVVFVGAMVVFFFLKKGRETPVEVDPGYQASLAGAGVNVEGGNQQTSAGAGSAEPNSDDSDVTGRAGK